MALWQIDRPALFQASDTLRRKIVAETAAQKNKTNMFHMLLVNRGYFHIYQDPGGDEIDSSYHWFMGEIGIASGVVFCVLLGPSCGKKRLDIGLNMKAQAF